MSVCHVKPTDPSDTWLVFDSVLTGTRCLSGDFKCGATLIAVVCIVLWVVQCSSGNSDYHRHYHHHRRLKCCIKMVLSPRCPKLSATWSNWSYLRGLLRVHSMSAMVQDSSVAHPKQQHQATKSAEQFLFSSASLRISSETHDVYRINSSHKSNVSSSAIMLTNSIPTSSTSQTNSQLPSLNTNDRSTTSSLNGISQCLRYFFFITDLYPLPSTLCDILCFN